MAKVTVEMTQAEYNHSIGDVPIVVTSLLSFEDLDEHAKTGYINRIARAVAGESNLSDYVQVEVEIKIVN